MRHIAIYNKTTHEVEGIESYDVTESSASYLERLHMFQIECMTRGSGWEVYDSPNAEFSWEAVGSPTAETPEEAPAEAPAEEDPDA